MMGGRDDDVGVVVGKHLQANCTPSIHIVKRAISNTERRCFMLDDLRVGGNGGRLGTESCPCCPG